MIRYRVTSAALRRAIDERSPGWLAEAAEKTKVFRKAGKYNEKQGSWSKIKRVYIDLQHGKCAYCETLLPRSKKSAIEHDVEHFRPKNAVRAWPTKKIQKELGLRYDFSTGSASTQGYFLLAYHVFNYATACKTCNTILKSNYFPIAGVRKARGDDPSKLKSEKPFLLYPIGAVDSDPEKLIAFHGFVPVPAKAGFDRKRAMVTIDFFRLGPEQGRDEDLLLERSQQIRSLYIAHRTLRRSRATQSDKRDARETIQLTLSPQAPHLNCARSYDRLCKIDFALAGEFFEAAREFLRTNGL